MIPIKPPEAISKGIVIYFPPLERVSRGVLSIDIFFSPNNPLFNWVNCSNDKALVWSNRVNVDPQGTMFLYETSKDLDLGFYTISASLLSSLYQPLSGQIDVPIISPTPYLIIGLPYSVYPPISLT